MAREKAYGIVHEQAMQSWEIEDDFRERIRSEPQVTERLSAEELETLFDYRYYVRHVDEIFQRVGLS